MCSPQAIHQRDELAERVGEVEEELTMAIQEIKKLDNANKQMSDVCKPMLIPTLLYAHVNSLKREYWVASVKWSDLCVLACSWLMLYIGEE